MLIEQEQPQQPSLFRQRPPRPAAPQPSDVNALRSQMQTEAVDAVTEDRYVIVEWGTGVGKSRVAVGAIRRLWIEGRRSILLLVAETAHKDNWRNEFTGALGEEEGGAIFDGLTVECYASLFKYENTGWDLIVADEAHHLRSDNRTCSLATMQARRVLCLSATLSENGDGDILLQTLQSTFGYFRRIRYSLNDAITSGILSEPKIYVHLLPRERISTPMEVKVDWGYPRMRRAMTCTAEDFGKVWRDPHRCQAASLTVTGTFTQLYDVLCTVIEDYRTEYDALYETMTQTSSIAERMRLAKRREWLMTLRKQYGMRRKTLIGRAKTVFATWLLSRLGDRKYVCFCSDVDQGERLGGDNIISARRNDNARVIAAFNDGTIRSLFAVGMIQEGQNLAGIEAGVILQLGGKERVFIQKFGRAMRSKTPEQHIVVINGTRDVTYYKQSVQGVDEKYIHIIRYKQQQAPCRSADRPA